MGLEQVIKGVCKAKVVAMGLDCLSQVWKLTEIVRTGELGRS
jgi:hypothetical protein